MPTQQPQTRNLLAEGLPRRQGDSDEEDNEDEDWGEDGGCFPGIIYIKVMIQFVLQ